MEIRKDIEIAGIPIIWQTNLADGDLRSLYLDLACDPDLPEAQLKLGGTSISLRLYNKTVPFKDGFCHCIGFNNRLTAIYRTEAEWRLWDAHRSEVDELEQEQEQERQVDIVLFCSSDDYLINAIRARLTAQDWASAMALLDERRKLRQTHEHLRLPLYAQGRWEIDQDIVEALVQVADIEIALQFLVQQGDDAAAFECYWESYFHFHFRRIEESLHLEGDPQWLTKVRQHPEHEKHLLLTKRIQDEALARFPRNGYLLKRVVLFWANHDRLAEAIAYCHNGIVRGLSDDTKTGFNGRLRRLQGRMQKNEAEHLQSASKMGVE